MFTLAIDFTFYIILLFLNIVTKRPTNGWTNGWNKGWKMFLSHTNAINASENDDFQLIYQFLQKHNGSMDLEWTWPLTEMR